MPSGKKKLTTTPHIPSGNQDSSHRHIGRLLKSQHLASSMSWIYPPAVKNGIILVVTDTLGGG